MKVKDIIKMIEPQWLPNADYDSISPKVTVVLPTFRGSRSGHFERAVESVLAQEYTNWELIIVDDASVDGTFDLIKFYMELDSRISCIRHTNNLGLPAISEYEAYIKARGEYIAYIFDDNVWDENHLLLSMKAMVKHNVKFTYGIARSYDKNMNFLDICLSLDNLPFTNGLGNGAVVIHKDVINTIGLYDPHVTLTRVCDWDLWIRISKKYVMHKIDTVVTSEYGAGLDDSLGNTVPMNPWVCREQMSYNRNESLLPSNFPEYVINDILPKSTDLFREFTEKYYHKYTNKCWFAEEVPDVNTDIDRSMKRVLIVLPIIDATYYMSFDNISCDIVTMVTPYNSISEKSFIFADIVIFYRDIGAALRYIPLCKDMNITAYYYTDDNFMELAKEKGISENETRVLNEIVKHYNRKDMCKFDGVLVSTDNLKQYLEDQRMNDNIIVLPPCADITGKISPFDNNLITIGFMGGKFREKIFANEIYPALVKLSEIKSVRLVCTNTLISRIKESYKTASNNIIFVEIKRDSCYNQIICRFRQEKVNILIHSGEKNKNNRFKTLNSLINSVQIGAVLLTSEVEPYTGNKAIVNVQNDTNSWFSVLKEYACDKTKLGEQYKLGYDYVCEHYSQSMVGEIFSDFIKDIKPEHNTDIINRYESVLHNATVPKVQQINTIQEIMTFNNDFIDKLLSFAAVTSKTDVYTIIPEAYSFSKIGFIISSDFDNYEGILKAEVYIKNRLVASAEMNMSDIAIRQVNYFDLGNVINPTGKIKVKLTAMYSGANNSTVGVYLVSSKKSLIYKVLKKAVGINLPITNLVYFDLK